MKNKLLGKTILALQVVMLFTSCENFLKAKGVQDEITKHIEYNIAEPYKIKVEAQKGSGIVTKPAAGEATVKPSDTFNLSFSSESDSQFLKWEVYNLITDEPLADNTYLQIENPLMIDTICTFVKEPEDENIQPAIRAITAKRPRVIRATPIDQETGVPRNSTVRILFDRFNMDPDCIYYTSEEMQELKTQLGLQDSDFLQADAENSNGKYYGYKKDEKHFFKNIEIVSSPVTGSSLTKYFYNPHWEKEPNDMGGSTLVIQTTNPPPPRNVVVYVTLAKDFRYFEDDIAVTLREATTLSYKTMYNRENKLPEAIAPKDSQNNDDYNVIKFKNEKGEYENLPYATYVSTDDIKAPDNTPYCKDAQYFYLSFNFHSIDEGGSGISSNFRLCCKNADLSEGEYEAPPIELPYTSYTEEEGFVDWSAEYIIPRTKYLKSARAYCFTIEALDNDRNYSTLRDDRGYPLYYWLYLSTPAVIY